MSKAYLSTNTAKKSSLQAIRAAAAKSNFGALPQNPRMQPIVAAVANNSEADNIGRVLGAALLAEAYAGAARAASMKVRSAQVLVQNWLSHPHIEQSLSGDQMLEALEDLSAYEQMVVEAENARTDACSATACADVVKTLCNPYLRLSGRIAVGTDTEEHSAAYTAAKPHIARFEKNEQDVHDSVNELLSQADERFVKSRDHALAQVQHRSND